MRATLLVPLAFVALAWGCATPFPGGGRAHAPPGDQPVPGIVVLHTRGGLKPHIDEYARFLSRHGYYAVTANYFRTGGTDNITAAFDALAANPRVAPGRIGMIGFSKGATQALQFAAYHHRHTSRRVRAIVSYYIGPRVPTATSTDHPSTLFVHGELDKMPPKTLLDYCRFRLREGTVCETVVYPGIGHGFDIPLQSRCDDCDGYHPRIAEDARMKTLEFLDTHLGN